MRSRLALILGLVVLLAVTAWVVWRLAFRDTTTPVSASEVIEEVADATPPQTEGAAGDGATTTVEGEASRFVVGSAPGDPGLYVYQTTGHEEIDALGGARHDYPAETFMTLQPGGCGLVVRWTVLAERWSENDVCRSEAGFSLAGFVSYHEWFGRRDVQEFSCDPATALVAPIVPLGAWSYACSTDERTEVWAVEVIGVESMQIGGEAVAAVHLRATSTLQGASDGTSETDTWFLEGTNLVLRRIATSRSVNESLIGDVTYTETFEIVLSSLQPGGARNGS